MYKRLKIYYLYTALPFIFLLSSAFVYRDAIVKTVVSNPHPQINYLIFVITLVGGVLILMSMKKLMYEIKQLGLFTDAQRQDSSAKELQEMALECDADIAYVLRMISATSKRAISHQEQIALENELQKARTRLSSRNALPQFLSGLLVGLGLLGTFIGLLATLDDIAILIGSFASLDMATADPIEVFGTMVNRMEAPMHSMGIAFSASMYGLLGSLVLSFMMVSLRRCMNEIIAILDSEIAQHIEFALAHDGFAYSQSGLTYTLNNYDAAPIALGDGITRPANETVDNQHEVENTTTQIDRPEQSYKSEELRILSRIEERMSEHAKSQDRILSAETKDFQHQRADMLRTLTENTEAATNFRTELQRVGRQLGAMLNVMEQSKTLVSEQMIEIKICMTNDATEIQRLMNILIETTKK